MGGNASARCAANSRRQSDISEALRPPEAYANFIGITEEPVAVMVHTLAANGCLLHCVLAAETKVYSLSHSDG
jgi:hypothetical protein